MIPNSIEKEKSLLPKLRLMGLILLASAFLTFCYSLLPEPPAEKMLAQEDFSPEIAELPPLNVYVVIGAFGAVGIACLFISWKKNRAFKP